VAIGPDTVITRNPNIMFSDFENSVVMMDVEAGDYYDVDETGAALWKLLEQPMTLQAACDRLTQEFDVDPETCQHDVSEFLEEVAQIGLVTLS